MPKFKGASGFGVDDIDEAINAEAGEGGQYSEYSGPTPPKGAYRGVLKLMRMTKTGPASKKPGTPMINYLVEIQEKGEKAKYNGYPLWGNQTIRKDSAGYINQMLEALVKGNAAKFKALKVWFWKGDIITEEEDGGDIIRIGKLYVNSGDDDKKHIDVSVYVKMSKGNAEYPSKPEVGRWLIPTGAASDDPDEDEAEIPEDEVDEDEAFEEGLDEDGDGEPPF